MSLLSNLPLPRFIPRNFLKFCLVGGSAAVASVGLLYLAVDIAHWPYLPAFVCVFVLVNACAYAASRRFAFSETSIAVQSGLLRYFSVTGASLLVNSAFLFILVEKFGLDPVVSSAILGLANAPLNFLVHRKLTFGIGRRATTVQYRDQNF